MIPILLTAATVKGRLAAVNYTLLVYDRAQAKLLVEREFDSKAEALAARFEAEAAHRQDGENVEVVVLAAESRADLMRTHSRYFFSLSELASQVG
jgi:hypothetical protein